MTHIDIATALADVNTGFTDANGQTLHLDAFGSFLACRRPLPANETILRDFDGQESEIKPSTLGRLKDGFSPEARYDADLTFNPEFLSTEAQTPFNHRYMFVGLKTAGRQAAANWGNFHDLTVPTNTFKLYLQVNHPEFVGSYMTDMLKLTADGESVDITKQYLKKYRTSEDEAHLKRCAALLIQECQIIRPEQLLVFSATTNKIMQEMSEAGYFAADPYAQALVTNRVVLMHYATRRKFGTWIKQVAPQTVTLARQQKRVRYGDYH